MTAELICVGTELLLGNIVNTNAAFLAEQCAALGLSMYYQSVVGDNAERLEGMLRTAVGRSDVVILSGGLGPTEDDLTKETAAKVMGRPLVEDGRAREEIARTLARMGRDITENNWKQALVPEGSKVLYNPNGTAPGIIMDGGGACVVLLPGPPNELMPMFKEQVAPYLAKKQPMAICSKMVKLCGIGESAAETRIKDLIDAQENPTIATYAKTGEVHLRVTARAEDEARAQELIRPVAEELKQRFGSLVYADDAQVTLEQSIAVLLEKYRLTLTTAESCTGGLLAGRLVNVPGISRFFKEGYVTYSNEAKEKRLGVSPDTLREHGAVSRQTAEEMALGGAKSAGADVCVAVTGIAGPDGGTAEKPVGLVYFGCYCKGRIRTEKKQFSGSRGRIREYSVATALTLLRQAILEDAAQASLWT